jgi:hypothetical protein
MIPVKEIVSSSAWFDCHSDSGFEKIRFKMRVLSFDKVDLSEVDDPHEVKIDYSSGNYWILKLELVNLTKKVISSGDVSRAIILVDQDEFSFDVVEDAHLSLYSGYAETSGLKRLYAGELMPKMKLVGAITFLLPDDDEAEYSLTIKKGNIEEA